MARRLTVFGGSGALVPHIVAAAQAAGYKVQVLAFTPQPEFPGVKVANADLGNPLGIIWSIKLFRTSHIVMAGAIVLTEKQREGLAKFARGSQAEATGAPPGLGDAALSGLANVLKSMTGAELVGVHQIIPELLAPAGHIAGPVPDRDLSGDLDFALGAAREIGRLDIGQAVVTTGRHIIATEDIAGTDSLISRVGKHVAAGIAGGGSSPVVLAKARKPQQTMLIDLPAVGPDTIVNAAAAGIGVIAVDAGGVLLIDRARIAELAETHAVSLIGRADV